MHACANCELCGFSLRGSHIKSDTMNLELLLVHSSLTNLAEKAFFCTSCTHSRVLVVPPLHCVIMISLVVAAGRLNFRSSTTTCFNY